MMTMRTLTGLQCDVFTRQWYLLFMMREFMAMKFLVLLLLMLMRKLNNVMTFRQSSDICCRKQKLIASFFLSNPAPWYWRGWWWITNSPLTLSLKCSELRKHHLHHQLHHRHQQWFLVCCFPRDLDPLTTQLFREKNKETRGKEMKKPHVQKRFMKAIHITIQDDEMVLSFFHNSPINYQ